MSPAGCIEQQAKARNGAVLLEEVCAKAALAAK